MTSKHAQKLKHTNYSREFCIFLPNVIKIDPYNFELHRFKIGAFETRCSNILAIVPAPVFSSSY